MKLVWPQEILDGQARRLELVVKVLDMPDKEIADRIGVSPQAWNNYTKGLRPFWGPAMLPLQRLIRITLDWLYFGDESGLTVGVLDLLKNRPPHVRLVRSTDPPAARSVRKRSPNR